MHCKCYADFAPTHVTALQKKTADECTVSVMLLLHQRTSRRKNKTADECTEKCYADFAPTHVTVVKKKLAK
jgi:hypothetical protein